MSEWTDDRIIDALQTQSTWFGNDAIIKCADAYDVVTQVRDDLQARIAELEAQLAAASQWQPVWGIEINGIEVDAGGNSIGMTAIDAHGCEWYAEAMLPDDIRLCRLSPQPPAVQMPPYHIREAIGNVWGYVYADGSLDDLIKAASLLMDWLHELVQQSATPQPPAVPTMPSEVREVLTTAMDNLYVDLEFEAIVLAPRIAQNMDAAYAWLDAHSPQEVTGE